MSSEVPPPAGRRPPDGFGAVPAGLRALVEQARLEWLAAQNEFDAVTEPELVDHAIFAVQAAERRYVYLLRLAGRLREQAGRAREEEPVPAAGVAGPVPAAAATEEGVTGSGPRPAGSRPGWRSRWRRAR